MNKILDELRAVGARTRCDELGRPVSVDLRGSDVSDEWLRRLSAFDSICELFLPVQTSDDGLFRLEGLPKLETLVLRYSSVGDHGIEHLANLPYLKHLDIAHTRATDRGLRALTRLTGLVGLDLRGLRVSRRGVDSLRRGLPMCHVTVDSHLAVTGESLPQRLARPTIAISNLGRLWCAANMLDPQAPFGTSLSRRPGRRDSGIWLSHSGDNGDTWIPHPLVVGPTGDGPEASFSPALWTDPHGRLWLFWTQRHRGHSVWAMMTDDPDRNTPRWTLPRRIADGRCVCSPLADGSGRWLLPAAACDFDCSVRLITSSDDGRSWQVSDAHRHIASDPTAAENWRLTESLEGDLILWKATARGVAEYRSVDAGCSWTGTSRPLIPHDDSAFHVGRLQNSGRLLLVKQGGMSERPEAPSRLAANLSEDEGISWHLGLLLDERQDVRNPDVTVDCDGRIYVVYERDRAEGAEVLLARFTEDDLLEHRIVDRHSRLRVPVASSRSHN